VKQWCGWVCAVADKGVCVPTVFVCCLVVWVEGAVRGERLAGAGLCRPLAAHAVGYPAVTLGVGVKAYVGHRLRLRRQRQVRAENDFYFQLMRDALPESALEQVSYAYIIYGLLIIIIFVIVLALKLILLLKVFFCLLTQSKVFSITSPPLHAVATCK
jgi:hypothetical protein